MLFRSGKLCNQICLYKSCTAKASHCVLCFPEKHSDCDKDLVIKHIEVPQTVLISNAICDTESFRNSFKKIATTFKQALNNRFDNWLDRLLRVYNKVTHDDLLNSAVVELVENGFNAQFDKENGKVKLISKLDSCTDSGLKTLLKAIDKRLNGILNDTLRKIMNVGFIPEDGIVEDQEDKITEEAKTKIDKLEFVINEYKSVIENIKASINDSKAKVNNLETAITKNDEIVHEKLKLFKIQNEPND